MGPSALQQEQSCENNKQTARFDQLNRNAWHVRYLLHGDAPANRFSVAAACKKAADPSPEMEKQECGRDLVKKGLSVQAEHLCIELYGQYRSE